MNRREFIPYILPFKDTKVEFVIDDQYDALKIINKGGQGHIIKAYDSSTLNTVAIKKIKQRNNIGTTKRVYREFVISRIIKHRNLVTLLDAFAPPNNSDLYLVYEYMDASMRDLISLPVTEPCNLKRMVWDVNNGDYFTADIMFQLFCGLRYLHQDRLKFIHRDVKPDNILLKRTVNGNWLLRLCDLGLARQLKTDDENITQYVITWPYRAPEVILNHLYTFAVDLWSVGCILAEMITGTTLFKRQTELDHFFRILYIAGVPEDMEFPGIIRAELNKNPDIYGPNRIDEHFNDNKLPNWTNKRISKQFIRDLLKLLLEVDPSRRLRADQGAHLPHFKFLEDRTGIDDIAPITYDFTKQNTNATEAEWKKLIEEELEDYEIKRFQNHNKSSGFAW